MKLIKKIILPLLLLIMILCFANVKIYKGENIKTIISSKLYKSGMVNSAFEDEAFYNCIVDEYNQTNGTSHPYTYNLSDEELNTIVSLTCFYSNITSAKGVEKLTSLSYLSLGSNDLTSLDVSKNTNLENLSVGYNQLTSLILGNLTSLTYLSVNDNKLTTLDISGLTSLTNLNIQNNQLTSLDVSNNRYLDWLYVQNNKLTSLDVSSNEELMILNVENNQLKSLDLSKNTELSDLNYNVMVGNNPYGNTYYVYKGNSVVVDEHVKVISNLNWASPVWSSLKEDIASVDQNRLVNTFKSGITDVIGVVEDKYTVTNKVNVVEITSDKYLIEETEKYIYVGLDKDVETIKSNIKLSHEGVNLNVDINNSKIQVMHDDDVLKEYKLIRISSDDYDLTKDYIYTKTSNFDISKINVINGTKETVDNELIIKCGDRVLETYDLVKISSTDYNLELKYIYTKTEEFDINKVNIINGEKTEKDNKLLIKYGEVLLDSYDLVKISSTDYNLELKYIYTKTSDFEINKVNVINANKEIVDNKLLIKYEEVLLETYDLVKISSDNYDLNLKYVYTKTNEFELSEVNITNGTKSLVDDKLLFKYEEVLLETYDIVSISSNNYDLNLKYIYTRTNEFDINKVSVINATKEVKNNKLQIKYGELLLETYDLVKISSDNYDLTNDYIYTKTKKFDETKVNVFNGTKLIEDNKLVIKYKDIILQIYDLVRITSDIYDLMENYIYTGTKQFDISKVTVTNGRKIITNNKLQIKYDELILQSYDLVSITSTDYDLTENYIYTGTKQFDISKVTVTNGTKKIENNQLLIEYGGILLQSLTLASVSSEIYDLNNDYIYLGQTEFDIEKVSVINAEKEVKNNKLVIKNGDEILKEYDLVSMSSEVYDLNRNYIYTGINSFDETKVNVINGEKIIQDNKLQIKYDDILLQEYKLASISSDIYNLTKEYIYTGTEDFDINKVNVINVAKEIIENKLVIKNDEEILQSYDIVSISSDDYDLNLNYIYTKTIEFDISKVSVINATKEVVGNKLQIKYGELLLETYDLVKISSDDYDLTKDYIYIGTTEIDISKVNVINGEKGIKNNKLLITYGDALLQSYDLVKIISEEYDLNKDYIYTRMSEFDETKVNIVNGIKSIEGNKLLLKYNDIILKEISVVNLKLNGLELLDDNIYISNMDIDKVNDKINVIGGAFDIENEQINILFNEEVIHEIKLLSIDLGNLIESNNLIVIEDNVLYDNFVSNITLDKTLNYKIINNKNEEITDGNIDEGYVLKIYYKDKVVDTFDITEEYIYFDEALEVDNNNYLSNVIEGTTVDNIIDMIDTSGSITIINNKNEEVTGESLVGTGTKISIKLNTKTIVYETIILGDIDGDGSQKIQDIMKIANYIYKDQNSLSGGYLIAADFDENGVYNIQDIMKLAKKIYG